MRRILLMLALLIAAPAAAQLPAQGSPADVVAHEAMTLIRSPFFVAHTLDMCPNPGSDVLRDSVRMAAARGMTRDQIVDDFVARHGEQLRLLPQRSGFGLWAWIAPPALLLIGLAFIAARLRRMRGQPVAGGGRALTEDERAQLDAALRGFDAEGAGA